MYQFFVEQGQVRSDRAYITGSDVNHIKNVLRMRVGEQVRVVMRDDPRVYLCEIENLSEQEVACHVCEILETDSELPVRIHLLQGLPKSDKMEVILQKAVELGAAEIVPVQSKNAVVKLDEKKAASKVTRYRAIAEAAAKQSKRRIVPEVHDLLTFREALAYCEQMNVKLIAYELADADGMDQTRRILNGIGPDSEVAVFIGPEGGFAPEEVELAKAAGFDVITLGRRILRTETAGMTILSWLVYILEK